jgi:CIC family chloride channel protein
MKKSRNTIQSAWAALTGWTNTEMALHHEDKVLLVLTLVIGALVGIVVVAFILVTENLGARMYPPGGTDWRRLVLPVTGALITGFLLQRYFPNARGSGIPQTKTALFIHDGVILFRTALGKFACSSVSLASGIALGREGPSVQVASGIASTLGRRLGLGPRRVKALIPIGSAAALAAAFNTPIAAVLFTLEEVMGDMHAPVLGSIVLSSATSWMVLHLILGDEPLFHVPAYQLVHPVEFAFYALLGIVGGLVSVGFVKLLLWQRKYFLRMAAWSAWFQPAAGGLVVGLLGWFVPQVLGVGYGYVSQALNGELVLRMMALLVLLKPIATATCYASGNAGGIFGPSLFMGAMLGGAFGESMHVLMPDYTASVGAYALVGMGTAFAGIIRVPLTSVIMIFEVTRDYTIIVPLMISNLMSYFISSRLQRTPIYEALLEQDGIRLPPAARDREELLLVDQACRPAAEVLGANDPVGYALSQVEDSEGAWPVLDGPRFLGMVTEDQLEEAARNSGQQPVRDLLPAISDDEEAFPHIYVDDSLDSAMRRMAQHGLKVLPVVSRTDMHDLRAVVSVPDILAAYGVEGGRRARVNLPRENRTTIKALVGTLAAFVFAIAIAALLTTFYRSERLARAQRDFDEGNALVSKQHYEEAIEKFRSAVSISHTPAHRLALAQALLSAGHLNEAAIYFGELLKEHPSSGPANLGFSRIYVGRNQIDDAIRSYHRAIYGNWTPETVGQRLQTRLELVDVLGTAGRKNIAQAELLALKSELPADPALRRRVARLFLKFGVATESVAMFRDLVKKNSNDDESYAGLGEAELALDDLAAAQTAFHNASRREPENAEYHANAELLDEMVAIDPVLRTLSAADRYRHSRNLLETVLATLDRCRSTNPIVEDPPADAIEKARRALERPIRPRSYRESTDFNITLARQLWSARAKECEPDGVSEQALSRIMSKIPE